MFWSIVLLAVGVIAGFGSIGLFQDCAKPELVEKKKENMQTAVVGAVIAIALIAWGIGIWPSGGANAPTKTAKPATAAVKHPDPAAVAKAQAKTTITAFDKVTQSCNDIITSYQSDLIEISDGSGDQSNVYSNLQGINDQVVILSTNTLTMSVPPQYKDAKDSLNFSVSYLQSSIGEALAYMDNKQISKLAEAKNDLKQAASNGQTAMVKVTQQAVKDGYTP